MVSECHHIPPHVHKKGKKKEKEDRLTARLSFALIKKCFNISMSHVKKVAMAI